jgi:hypothetical protein
MWKDPATGEMRGGIAKTGYTHEALADIILGNPAITQNELARHFGYTAGWISQILASDSFQAYLNTRKEQIVDPMLRGAVEESFKGLVLQSVERLRQKLEANPTDDLVLEVFKASTKALGYGAKPSQTNIQINQTNNSLVGVLSSLPPAARVVEQA